MSQATAESVTAILALERRLSVSEEQTRRTFAKLEEHSVALLNVKITAVLFITKTIFLALLRVKILES